MVPLTNLYETNKSSDPDSTRAMSSGGEKAEKTTTFAGLGKGWLVSKTTERTIEPDVTKPMTAKGLRQMWVVVKLWSLFGSLL